MRACDKCLENRWSYEFVDGWVKATCECGATKEWEAKKQQPQELREGAPCRKDQNPIRLRQSKFKKKKLKKAYYYNAYWWCDKCRTIYYDEKFKVLNQDVMNENIAASLALARNYDNSTEAPVKLSPDAENVRRKRDFKKLL